MTRHSLPLLVALTCLAAACGSDGTLPSADVPPTAPPTVPATAPPTVPVTDPPVTTVPDDSPQAQLDAAIARWEAQGPSSYTMVTRQLCFCVEQHWSDTVVDGEVTEHVPLTEESFFDPGPNTMLSLFAAVQNVIDEGYASLDLSFDPDTGALLRYFVDLDEMMADEESGIEVISVEPLG